MIANASQAQRAPDPWSFLCGSSRCTRMIRQHTHAISYTASFLDLPFPPLALLIASFHLHTAGHDTFTFEHVYHVYSRAARQSTSTNVSLDGVVIGLGKVSRDIMVGVSFFSFFSREDVTGSLFAPLYDTRLSRISFLVKSSSLLGHPRRPRRSSSRSIVVTFPAKMLKPPLKQKPTRS